jgi:hypothetical protein
LNKVETATMKVMQQVSKDMKKLKSDLTLVLYVPLSQFFLCFNHRRAVETSLSASDLDPSSGAFLGDTGISDIRQDIANDYEHLSQDLKLTVQLPKLKNIWMPVRPSWIRMHLYADCTDDR